MKRDRLVSWLHCVGFVLFFAIAQWFFVLPVISAVNPAESVYATNRLSKDNTAGMKDNISVPVVQPVEKLEIGGFIAGEGMGFGAVSYKAQDLVGGHLASSRNPEEILELAGT
ncbi:MAG: hypothetical protein JW893_06025 [Candidatus Omnitrophica bacterium]|nr:hypothetical protein [Candidatus Omnitrophota bacterium]